MGLSVKTGEVDVHRVVTVDETKGGTVGRHDGVLVENLASVGLKHHPTVDGR